MIDVVAIELHVPTVCTTLQCSLIHGLPLISSWLTEKTTFSLNRPTSFFFNEKSFNVSASCVCVLFFNSLLSLFVTPECCAFSFNTGISFLGQLRIWDLKAQIACLEKGGFDSRKMKMAGPVKRLLSGGLQELRKLCISASPGQVRLS